MLGFVKTAPSYQFPHKKWTGFVQSTSDWKTPTCWVSLDANPSNYLCCLWILFFYLRSMIRSSIVLISPFHGEGFKSTKKITLGHRHRIPSKSASRAKVRSKGKAALATNQHVGGGWTNMYWIISPRIGGIGVKILKKSNNHLEHPDCHHPCFSSNEKIAPFPPPKFGHDMFTNQKKIPWGFQVWTLF